MRELQPPPLMSAVKARNVARAYKALADNLAEIGVLDQEAARAERNAQWWLTYSIALSQIPPGAIDDTGSL